MHFTYQPASRSGLEAIWKKNIQNNPTEPEWATWRDEYIENHFSQKSTSFLVSADDEPIGEGTLLFSPECRPIRGRLSLADGKTIANINALRIEKAYEGQGHISRLVKKMEAYAKALGYTTITIGVEAHQTRNAAIYLHWGYTRYVMSEVEDGTLVLYYAKDLPVSPFRIRPLRLEDAPIISDAFLAQGWKGKTPAQYEQYYQEQQAGQRQVFVAEVSGQFAGYVTLLPEAQDGPFAHRHLPEISDFNVLEKYQRQGIGSALMDAAEAAAFKISPIVTLGVGLHYGYGSAQRMYIKRGYLFDGSGVWYQGQRLEQYAPCVNDDDLVLYLSKQL